MMKRGKYSAKYIYCFLFYIFLFIYTQVTVFSVYGPIIFPDEIGYWGSAAAMKGYDWSGIVSLNSYYSYGYGILLSFILSITSNAVLAYRIAICMNAILMGISFLLLYKIGKEICPEQEEKQIQLSAMCGVLYSAFLFCMQVTMSEILLMTLYLVILYLIFIYLKNPKSITAIALAVAFVYIYIVHMRTVAILIAGLISMILLGICHKRYRNSLIIAFLCAALGLSIGVLVKDIMTESLYTSAQLSTLAGNDYAGQWDKIKAIFTIDGSIKLLMSIVGKIFYLGIATFGIFYYGILFLIKKCICYIKYKDAKNIIWLFLLLSFIGQFMITAVYMMGSEVVDATLYGRYHEMVLPVIILLGIQEILQERKLKKKTIYILAGQSILLAIIALYWKAIDAGFRHTCFVTGITYAADRWDFNRTEFVLIMLFAGAFFYMGTAFLINFIKKDKKWTWLLSILILLQIGIAWDASKDYVYLHNGYNYSDILLGMEMRDKVSKGRKIYFSYTKENTEYIGLLQMGLMEYPLRVAPPENEDCFTEKNIIVTYYNNEKNEELSEKYRMLKESTHFKVFYNP